MQMSGISESVDPKLYYIGLEAIEAFDRRIR